MHEDNKNSISGLESQLVMIAAICVTCDKLAARENLVIARTFLVYQRFDAWIVLVLSETVLVLVLDFPLLRIEYELNYSCNVRVIAAMTVH